MSVSEHGSIPGEAVGIGGIAHRAGDVEQNRAEVDLGAALSDDVPGSVLSGHGVAGPPGAPVGLAASSRPHVLSGARTDRFAGGRQLVRGAAEPTHVGEDEGPDYAQPRIGSGRPLVESRRLTEESQGTAQ